jgi:hypothetical protein
VVGMPYLVYTKGPSVFIILCYNVSRVTSLVPASQLLCNGGRDAVCSCLLAYLTVPLCVLLQRFAAARYPIDRNSRTVSIRISTPIAIRSCIPTRVGRSSTTVMAVAADAASRSWSAGIRSCRHVSRTWGHRRQTTG